MQHRATDHPTASEPTGRTAKRGTALPTEWHEHIAYEVEAAWHDGYAQALTDTADRSAELDATWLPTPRRTHEETVAARAASMPPAEGVQAWLDRWATRCRQHDAAAIAAAVGARTTTRTEGRAA